MRNLLYLVATIFLFAACKDESVEIITLGKAGDTFYFGEKVQVWAGVEGNLHQITYDWECTGGEFDGYRTQHLFENLWIAPSVPGEYLIKATAKTGGSSDSRITKMKVTNYFTETFDYGARNPAGWASSNTTLAYGMDSANPSDLIVSVPATSNSSDANLRRTLTAVKLVPPFSIKTKMKYTSYKTATAVTASNAATFLSIYFVQPDDNLDKPYIREIRLDICPPATGANWRLRMESYVPALGRSSWTGSTPVNPFTPGNLSPNGFQGTLPLFSFPRNEYRSFSFTIDAEKKFSIYIDGNAWVDKSNAINEFINVQNLSKLDLQVREFRLTVPRKSSSNAANTEMQWAITDVCINDVNTAIGGDVSNIGFEELK
ncbi:hypothetical protein EZS27_002883 [termite gut metagenome]|uniref:Uncharacterized protein n=1 Tax=termite gut metagenome TaxID=433724 RepID=A0A5J4SWN6_9ZZZZ